MTDVPAPASYAKVSDRRARYPDTMLNSEVYGNTLPPKATRHPTATAIVPNMGETAIVTPPSTARPSPPLNPEKADFPVSGHRGGGGGQQPGPLQSQKVPDHHGEGALGHVAAMTTAAGTLPTFRITLEAPASPVPVVKMSTPFSPADSPARGRAPRR